MSCRCHWPSCWTFPKCPKLQYEPFNPKNLKLKHYIFIFKFNLTLISPNKRQLVRFKPLHLSIFNICGRVSCLLHQHSKLALGCRHLLDRYLGLIDHNPIRYQHAMALVSNLIRFASNYLRRLGYLRRRPTVYSVKLSHGRYVVYSLHSTFLRGSPVR